MNFELLQNSVVTVIGSNAVLITHSDYAFFFWGINDSTHEVVGTTFDWNIEPKIFILA